jgi:molybdopterin-guanine dinucleotide biosynthesis protein A
MTDHSIYGLILTGGSSRRMGSDKAMLEYRDQPQAVYLTTIMEQLNISTYISCRKGDGEKWDPFKTIEDAYTGIGPLAGILSAFDQFPNSAFFVLACDYPLLRTRDLKWLLESRSFDHHVTAISLPQNKWGEPLLAIWEPSSHTALRQAYQSGNYRLMDLLSNLDVQLVSPESPTFFQQANDQKEKAQLDEFLKHHST